jgi:hypothetical protein
VTPPALRRSMRLGKTIPGDRDEHSLSTSFERDLA